MSLRDLAENVENKSLQRSVMNAFALLNDLEILQVCEAITNMSASAAADTIIELVGPESARAASVLPGRWAPASLADLEIASKVVVAAAIFKGKGAPSKDDLKRAIEALALSPAEKQAAHVDVEKVAESGLTWGLFGRLLADGVIAILAKRIPLLRFAPRSQFLLKAAATAVGGAIGVERALPPGAYTSGE
jgi:hypothetical protein